ncbi:MAG: hypothetical protein GF308_05825 [Candidatus Heimdallarchaeota archaeon]|nr:hypothetical protein [Candidatus Heimdallarchaeota archaeon]
MPFNKKKETKEEIGSRTAKRGFRNEDLVMMKFYNWEEDLIAQKWLSFICKQNKQNYDNLSSVKVEKIAGRHKADILVQLIFKNNSILDAKISLKRQKGERGYNHIHRENAAEFAERFNFSPVAKIALLKYCGVQGYSPFDLYQKGELTNVEYEQYDDIPEKKKHREGTGRFYFDELEEAEQRALINNFSKNIQPILRYILRGEKGSEHPADYLLCTKDLGNDKKLFSIETIAEAIDRAYDDGVISPLNRKHSSLHMGLLTVQRKGGTGGATQLQFKWTNVFPDEKALD